jgi:hypothetical protein
MTIPFSLEIVEVPYPSPVNGSLENLEVVPQAEIRTAAKMSVKIFFIIFVKF